MSRPNTRPVYHCYWCPWSLHGRGHAISGHAIDYVLKHVFLWGMISTTCVIPLSMNDRKYLHIRPQMNSLLKRLMLTISRPQGTDHGSDGRNDRKIRLSCSLPGEVLSMCNAAYKSCPWLRVDFDLFRFVYISLIKPLMRGARIILGSQVNTITVDALATCVARSAATIILTMKYRVLNGRGM